MLLITGCERVISVHVFSSQSNVARRRMKQLLSLLPRSRCLSAAFAGGGCEESEHFAAKSLPPTLLALHSSYAHVNLLAVNCIRIFENDNIIVTTSQSSEWTYNAGKLLNVSYVAVGATSSGVA